MFTYLFAGSIAAILLKLICVALFGVFAFFIGREAYRTFKTNRLFAKAWAEAVGDAEKLLKAIADAEAAIAAEVAAARQLIGNPARVPMKLMTMDEARARHDSSLASYFGSDVVKLRDDVEKALNAPKQGESGVNVAGEGVAPPAESNS